MAFRFFSCAAKKKEEKESKPPTRCSTFWRSPKLSSHLNIVATLSAVIDSALDLISARSTWFETFISETVPYYVSSFFYIGPTLLVFIPSLIDFCKVKPIPNSKEKDLKELEDILSSDLEIADIFRSNEKLSEKILEKVDEYEKKKNKESWYQIINLIFLSLRAVQGIAILMEGVKATERDTTEEAASWIELMSEFINIIYMCTMLVSFHQSRKKITKNELDEIDESSEESLSVSRNPSPSRYHPTYIRLA